MKYGDKEKIYDEQIFPLMSQIIGICKENKINMVSSFQLRSGLEENGDENEGDFCCTTALPMNRKHYPQRFKDFYKSLYSSPAVLAMTITKAGEQS